MAGRIKPQAKIALFVIGGAALLFSLRYAASQGWIPTPNLVKAFVPQKIVLPDIKEAKVANVTPAPLPQEAVASVPSTKYRGVVWEWSAMNGLFLANGGASTTEGSLMAKRAVNLDLYRQDITDKMKDDLASCAKELYGGATQCSNGANFAIIMSGGSPNFIATGNHEIDVAIGDKEKAKPYHLKTIGSVGASYGEDAFMAPPEVKKNPAAAKGMLFSGVILDDDWNIAIKWTGDNHIKNNPDDTTYDPDAINWINSSDYNQAAADYNANKCVDLKVVKDGYPTGETKKVCVSGTVTWLPGDATVASGRGGLVKIVSSRQYAMLSVVVGIGKFFADNKQETANLLAAAWEGGDQVKAFDKASRKAAQIAAVVYKDEGGDGYHNGEFWYKYFKGTQQRDSQGLIVDIGGSQVHNLDDAMTAFGLKAGANDNYRSIYNVFAKVDVEQYPKLFEKTPIPDVKDVEDRSYIALANATLVGDGDIGSSSTTVDYSSQRSAAKVSKDTRHIEFAVGSATLTPKGQEQVRELKDDLAITNLFVYIDGYTDNTGSDTVNIPLSENRARSVKSYLQSLSNGTFPDERFSVRGHGSQDPAEDNSTTAGKAANRRVVITLTGN